MKPHPPTASGSEGTCRQVRDTLVQLEREDMLDAAAAEALDTTSSHLETCGACRARLGARLSRLQGLHALRERSAPEGTFDSFFDQVRERVPFAPAGGGMSPAFLDAPRSLRLWRSAALAAGVLLAVTAGFAFTRVGGRGVDTAAERPLHDPRERLLEAYDARPDVRNVRSVRDATRRGYEGFFRDEDVITTPVGGAGWR